MKKTLALLLCALFVFGMASYAMAADVDFGGEMRVRGIMKGNYDMNDGTDDDNSYYDQRLRLTATVTVGDIKAMTRMTVSEGTWGTVGGTYNNVALHDDDYAYLAIPAGAGTVSVGRMHADWGNKFLVWNAGTDRIKYVAKAGDLTWAVLTDKKREDGAGTNDTDYDDYGALVIGMAGDVKWGVIGVQYIDSGADVNGTAIDAFFSGPVAGLSMAGELAMQTGDLFGNDANMGFFVAASKDMGSFMASAALAYAADGYTASGYFTPTNMIGTTNTGGIVNFNGAEGQDPTMAIVVGADFNLSDEKSAGVKLGFVTADAASSFTESAVELDATFNYAFAEKAAYRIEFGYLTSDADPAMTLSQKVQVNF